MTSRECPRRPPCRSSKQLISNPRARGAVPLQVRRQFDAALQLRVRLGRKPPNAEGYDAGPDVEFVILFVVEGRAAANLRGCLADREAKHGGRLQLVWR